MVRSFLLSLLALCLASCVVSVDPLPVPPPPPPPASAAAWIVTGATPYRCSATWVAYDALVTAAACVPPSGAVFYAAPSDVSPDGRPWITRYAWAVATDGEATILRTSAQPDRYVVVPLGPDGSGGWSFSDDLGAGVFDAEGRLVGVRGTRARPSSIARMLGR